MEFIDREPRLALTAGERRARRSLLSRCFANLSGNAFILEDISIYACKSCSEKSATYVERPGA